MISKRKLKFLEVAKAAAKLSDIDQYKLGSVIESTSGEIIAVAFNQAKSHPLQKHYNKKRGTTAQEWSFIHAELAATNKVKNKKKLEGATIYVGRTRRDGSNGLARPCPACMDAIRKYKIKQIIYTLDDGVCVEKVEVM